MKLSDAGAQLMHRFEGFKDKPYLCPAHLWTIGYGHVLYPEQIRLPVKRSPDRQAPTIRREYPLRPQDSKVFSKEEIDALFSKDVSIFERGVLRLVPGTAGRQSSFDALVSFAFNVGLGNLQRSTVRARANRGDWEGAAEALMMWTRGGGRVLPGLVRRRQAEREMFLA